MFCGKSMDLPSMCDCIMKIQVEIPCPNLDFLNESSVVFDCSLNMIQHDLIFLEFLSRLGEKWWKNKWRFKLFLWQVHGFYVFVNGFSNWNIQWKFRSLTERWIFHGMENPSICVISIDISNGNPKLRSEYGNFV